MLWQMLSVLNFLYPPSSGNSHNSEVLLLFSAYAQLQLDFHLWLPHHGSRGRLCAGDGLHYCRWTGILQNW